MSLFAPLNLLWLLPLAGTLLALYFLRPRRRNQAVSSLLLWSAIVESSRSDKPFQRLKFSLLLILQLLGLLLLTLVLALPMSRPHLSQKSTTVLVLDQSAAMKATDVTPNRYAALRAAAELFVRQNLRGDDTALIVGAGPGPTLISGETRDKSQLIRKIESSEPSDTPSDIEAAVGFAHIIARNADSIVLFSDASWGPALDSNLIARAGVPLHLITVGTTSAENAGIIAMSGRTDELHPNNAPQVLVTIDRRHSQSGTLTLTANDHVTSSVSIPAGNGVITKIFTSPGLTKGSIVTAKLSGMSRDDLSSDDVATIVVKASGTKKLLLVTDGDPYLERALALFPGIDLYEIKPAEFAAAPGEFDVIVYDQWLPKTLPAGSALVLDAVNPDMPVQLTGGPYTASQIVDWDEADPILSYVDLSDVHVKTGLSVQVSDWGTAVADMHHGPAIVKGSKDGHSIVWIGFAPGDSDLPVQAAFPILLSNIVETLSNGEQGVTAGRLTGDSVQLPPVSSSWSVTDPNGRTSEVFCNEISGCDYTGTMTVGIYTAKAGDVRQVFACNLANDGQTDLAVKQHPMLSYESGGPMQRTKRRTNLSPWMALVALAIVLIEWLIYNRGLRYTRPI
jgi:hypothetical protein